MSVLALLKATRALHAASPEMADFGAWPTDLTWADVPPVRCPAVELLSKLPAGLPLLPELIAAAPLLEWRRTYTADEVGQDFLDRYGYVELFGPRGAFHSTQLRGYIAFWDAGLDYGWHNHRAEEIYFALHGTPLFLSKTQPEARLKPGQTRHHTPWEEHGMQTLETPFFCYALWRGDGLDALPRLTQ